MSMDNLISGTIWDEYSNKVAERMNNPKNSGEITEEMAKELGAKLIIADFGAESCGDAVRLYWAVDESNDKIIMSKFMSFGCGTAVASSDVMAELCIGKTVDEAVKITNIDVEFAMRDNPETPAVPPQKMHCSVMAYDVIKKAAAQYKGVDAESFEEEVIVCECARVTLSTLQETIKLNNLTTIEEIIDYTKAGGFCKSCIRPGGHEEKDIYLVDLLEDAEKEKAVESGEDYLKGEAFDTAGTVAKLRSIEAVIDKFVRAALHYDGGDMEILDIKDNQSGGTDVYIRYMGACSGCASSGSSTLYAILSVLQDKISENINIYES